MLMGWLLKMKNSVQVWLVFLPDHSRMSDYIAGVQQTYSPPLGWVKSTTGCTRYGESLHCRYNPRKGFYCQVVREDHTQCLGRSKGRQYPPMDPHAELFLQSYYRQGNAGLAKLLNRLKQPIPEWLADDLHDTR